MFFLFL